MKKLRLFKSLRHALIDDEDFERCSQHSWVIQYHDNKNIPKSIRSFDAKKHLAAFILNYSGSLTPDHKDRDIYNNQKSNLRLATPQQQQANKEKSIGNYSSKYKGVSWIKKHKCWFVTIGIKGKMKYLGCFDNEDKAAEAYNIAAIKYFKEFACLNKIEEPICQTPEP